MKWTKKSKIYNFWVSSILDISCISYYFSVIKLRIDLIIINKKIVTFILLESWDFENESSKKFNVWWVQKGFSCSPAYLQFKCPFSYSFFLLLLKIPFSYSLIKKNSNTQSKLICLDNNTPIYNNTSNLSFTSYKWYFVVNGILA